MRENLGEVEREQRSIWIGPMRVIHARLHGFAVEIAVGKAVDRAYCNRAFAQPVAKSRDSIGLEQKFARALRREPKPNTKHFVGSGERAHSHGVLIELLEADK